MKRILITGADSYIGTSFEKWLKKYPDEYSVNTIDLRDSIWKEKTFKNYDVVFHVAGIAHVDIKKTSDETKSLYYKVNRDLAIEAAKKARSDGVRQFVFMSSIIIYGDSSYMNKKKIINMKTLPQPSNFYGSSKLQGEEGIRLLECDDFNVAILRPPMIYGKNSKGNYPKISKIAQKIPLFPDVDNERSMLHIDNLCEFIRVIINQNKRGLFFPQNSEYVKTSEMVKCIAAVHGKKIKLTKIFNGLLSLLAFKVEVINKVFGNLVYERSMSEFEEDYQVRPFIESIEQTELRVEYE